MTGQASIMLFVSDRPMLSSLQFSLALEGFEVIDGAADGIDPSAAVALVIDENYLADGLAVLAALRARRCTSPAIVLATLPGRAKHALAAAVQAALIEKPLLDEELTRTLHAILQDRAGA